MAICFSYFTGKIMKEVLLQPKKIIVRMPNWLGDFIMALPVLEDIREKFPVSKITAMAKDPFCDLLKTNNNIDDVFCFKKPSSSLFIKKEHKQIIDKIKKGNFDLGILLTNSFSSAFWFFKGKVKKRVGFSLHFRRFLLNNSVPVPKDVKSQHLVKTYKNLISTLGISISRTKPRLFISDEEKDNAFSLLQRFGYEKNKALVAINPGAAYGLAKCWFFERFHEVAKSLVNDENCYVVFLGDMLMQPLIQKITMGLNKRAIDLSGKTDLIQLCGVISYSNVLLSNDSGPMHIASAVGVTSVALFGSTNEAVTGPYDKGDVIHKHVSCSPCYKRVCPNDMHCMKAILVEEVLERVKKYL